MTTRIVRRLVSSLFALALISGAAFAQSKVTIAIGGASCLCYLPTVLAKQLGEYEKAGVEKIAFAWAGPVTPGEKHYYRVQGPTFVIEFDNTQNNGNHVHSVWRDFDSDFGRDLLREHLAMVRH